MKTDRFISVILYSIYGILLIFALISLGNPEWLQDLSEEGRTTEASTHMEEGNKMMYAGKFNSAIPHYQKALSIDTTNRNIYGNLGVAYTKVGAYEKATKCFNAFRRLSGNLDSLSLFSYFENMGNLEKAIGINMNNQKKNGNEHLKKALHFYQQAIEKMPYEPNLNYKYAHLAKQLGMDSLAIHEFRTGISKHRTIDTYYYSGLLTAYLHAAENTNSESVKKLEDHLNKDQDIPWERYDTISIKRYQQTQSTLGLAYLNLGELYLNNNKTDQAEYAFGRAISIDPKLSGRLKKLKERYHP